MALFGTSLRRQHTGAPARADELAGITLPDHQGDDHRLGDFWRDSPAALIWLRHYG